MFLRFDFCCFGPVNLRGCCDGEKDARHPVSEHLLFPLQTVLFSHSSISVATLWPDAVSAAVFPNDGHLISPPLRCPVVVLAFYVRAVTGR